VDLTRLRSRCGGGDLIGRADATSVYHNFGTRRTLAGHKENAARVFFWGGTGKLASDALGIYSVLRGRTTTQLHRKVELRRRVLRKMMIVVVIIQPIFYKGIHCVSYTYHGPVTRFFFYISRNNCVRHSVL